MKRKNKYQLKGTGFVFCLLFLQLSSLSQVIQVTDSSGAGVSYATVEIPGKKQALFTDAKGQLNCTALKMAASDTLVFSSIGFITLRTEWSKVSGKVVLERQVKQLQEAFAYNSDWKKVWLGATDKKLERFSSMRSLMLDGPGQQLARAIYPNQDNKKTGYIEKISFQYGHAASSMTPVRLRIYDIGKDGMPGEDLLTESVVRKLEQDQGWLEFDLRDNPVKMTHGGIVVAAEFFDTDSAYWHQEPNWMTTDSAGKVLTYTENILGCLFRIDDLQKDCHTFWRKNGVWERRADKWLIKPYDCYNLVVKVWVKYPK